MIWKVSLDCFLYIKNKILVLLLFWQKRVYLLFNDFYEPYG